MVRGRNPDGTPKVYPADERRKSKRKYRQPYPEAIVPGNPDLRDHGAAKTQNPALMQRLEMVERYRLAGMSAYTISRETGLPLGVVLEDWQRLNDLWVARVGRTQETLRGEAVRRLDNLISNGLAILEMDERYTQGVLFNIPVMITCPGRVEHRTLDMLLIDPLQQPTGTTYGEAWTCIRSHQMQRRVARDEKGSAQYRRIAGQVMQAINSAIMAQARIQGLIVEKKALTDGDGRDLPQALRTLLLGDDPPDIAALPSVSEELDGLA